MNKILNIHRFILSQNIDIVNSFLLGHLDLNYIFGALNSANQLFHIHFSQNLHPIIIRLNHLIADDIMIYDYLLV